jgi:hypothetical protein
MWLGEKASEHGDLRLLRTLLFFALSEQQHGAKPNKIELGKSGQNDQAAEL